MHLNQTFITLLKDLRERVDADDREVINATLEEVSRNTPASKVLIYMLMTRLVG